MSLPESFIGRIIFIVQKYGLSMLKGAGTTLNIAIVGTVIGCIIGFIVGTIQATPINKKDSIIKRILLRAIKILMDIYVEVFRGTPMMVQAMFLFYGSAVLFNIHMDMWTAAYFIVSINTGAYMAETVRGGILSIPDGQTEGAMAIGMNYIQTMFYVILPQALKNIMPQIGNNLIINIKDTCVLSVIGVVELFFVTKTVSGAYYTVFEANTITMAMYLFMTVILSKLLRIIEKKLNGPENYSLSTTDTLAYTSGLLKYPSKEEQHEKEYNRN